jgi:hypothetical protein
MIAHYAERLLGNPLFNYAAARTLAAPSWETTRW